MPAASLQHNQCLLCVAFCEHDTLFLWGGHSTTLLGVTSEMPITIACRDAVLEFNLPLGEPPLGLSVLQEFGIG